MARADPPLLGWEIDGHEPILSARTMSRYGHLGELQSYDSIVGLSRHLFQLVHHAEIDPLVSTAPESSS